MDDNPDGMIGSGKIRIETDRQRAQAYLHSLQNEFAETQVQGLAEDVLSLLNTSPYAARIEREVISARADAVNNHYINRKLNTTLRGRLPVLSRWWGHDVYQAFARDRLEGIVSGYKPKEAKK